jgi:antitoxin VapB
MYTIGDTKGTLMSTAASKSSGTGRVFMHGRSQAVRLPKEFRLPGNEVSVTRFGNGLLIEPKQMGVREWLAELKKYEHLPFMEDGREQPQMPESKVDLDDPN